MLTLKDFDYELPRELVAIYPAPKRSKARLLVLDRRSGRMTHRIFKDLSEYLQKGDLLVLNNTKVLPARLYGRRPTGGKVEALLLKRAEENVWEVLVKPCGRIRKGTQITFGENGIRLEGEILDEPDGVSGIRRIRFHAYRHPGTSFARHSEPRRGEESQDEILRFAQDDGERLQDDAFKDILHQIGRIPLPPYIDRPDEAADREFYQTVFAQKEGAVASPTAGLHFDEELLTVVKTKGVEICFVTLHVSYGTFQPVQTEDLSQHQMFEEEFEITDEAVRQIRCAKKEGRRIVACGTTVVRVLETVGARQAVPLLVTEHSRRPAGGHSLKQDACRTRLFIYPPYEFQMVDAMITNFHVPRSTLLMLVCAFAGRDFIFRAYEEAIRERYRFYSYGDAMLIL